MPTPLAERIRALVREWQGVPLSAIMPGYSPRGTITAAIRELVEGNEIVERIYQTGHRPIRRYFITEDDARAFELLHARGALPDTIKQLVYRWLAIHTSKDHLAPTSMILATSLSRDVVFSALEDLLQEGAVIEIKQPLSDGRFLSTWRCANSDEVAILHQNAPIDKLTTVRVQALAEHYEALRAVKGA